MSPYADNQGAGPAVRVPQRRRRLDPDTGRYRPLSEAQKQVNTAHARQRGPGERVNAQLKNWRILRKIRSCPGRASQLVAAVPALMIASAQSSWQRLTGRVGGRACRARADRGEDRATECRGLRYSAPLSSTERSCRAMVSSLTRSYSSANVQPVSEGQPLAQFSCG